MRACCRSCNWARAWGTAVARPCCRSCSWARARGTTVRQWGCLMLTASRSCILQRTRMASPKLRGTAIAARHKPPNSPAGRGQHPSYPLLPPPSVTSAMRPLGPFCLGTLPRHSRRRDATPSQPHRLVCASLIGPAVQTLSNPACVCVPPSSSLSMSFVPIVP